MDIETMERNTSKITSTLKDKKFQQMIISIGMICTLIYAFISFLSDYSATNNITSFISNTAFYITVIAFVILYLAWKVLIKGAKITPPVDMNKKSTQTKVNFPNPFKEQSQQTLRHDIPSFEIKESLPTLKKVIPVMGTWWCPCGFLAYGNQCIQCKRFRK